MSDQPSLDLFTPVLTDLGEGWASTPPHQPAAKETRRKGLAAAALSRDTLWHRMLQHYAHGPLTDAQLAEWLCVERSTINARRAELVKLGKVKDTGRTERNPKSGVENTLWGLA